MDVVHSVISNQRGAVHGLPGCLPGLRPCIVALSLYSARIKPRANAG